MNGCGGPDACRVPSLPHLKSHARGPLSSWQLSRLFVSGAPAPAPTSLPQREVSVPEPDRLAAVWAEAGHAKVAAEIEGCGLLPLSFY